MTSSLKEIHRVASSFKVKRRQAKAQLEEISKETHLPGVPHPTSGIEDLIADLLVSNWTKEKNSNLGTREEEDGILDLTLSK